MSNMIYIEKSDLLKALKIVRPAVSARSTIPILQTVHIAVTPRQMTITASNLELSIRTALPVIATDTSAVCLPYKSLLKIIAPMTKQISMNIKEDAVFYMGNSQIELEGLPANEFPEFYGGNISKSGASDIFTKIARRVVFSCETTNDRPVLTGVYLNSTSGRMNAAATDGYRLTVLETKYRLSENVIVPACAIKEIAKLSNPSVYIDKGQIIAVDDSTTIVSVLIDGKYPNIDAVTPQHHPIKIMVDCNDLLGSIRPVLAIVEKDEPCVKISNKMISGTQGILVTYKSYTTWLPVQQEGENIKPIGFNVHYLMDALNAAGEGEITLGYTSPTHPMTIRGQDENWKHVIMPMKV